MRKNTVLGGVGGWGWFFWFFFLSCPPPREFKTSSAANYHICFQQKTELCTTAEELRQILLQLKNILRKSTDFWPILKPVFFYWTALQSTRNTWFHILLLLLFRPLCWSKHSLLFSTAFVKPPSTSRHDFSGIRTQCSQIYKRNSSSSIASLLWKGEKYMFSSRQIM